MKRAEDAAQRALFSWLGYQLPAIAESTIHVPNGGGRSKAEAGILKALGVRPGVPDVLSFERRGHYAGLALELKAPPGVRSTVSTAQSEWIERLRAHGWRAEVARGFDQAREIFEDYLAEEIDEVAPDVRALEIIVGLVGGILDGFDSLEDVADFEAAVDYLESFGLASRLEDGGVFLDVDALDALERGQR